MSLSVRRRTGPSLPYEKARSAPNGLESPSNPEVGSVILDEIGLANYDALEPTRTKSFRLIGIIECHLMFFLNLDRINLNIDTKLKTYLLTVETKAPPRPSH